MVGARLVGPMPHAPPSPLPMASAWGTSPSAMQKPTHVKTEVAVPAPAGYDAPNHCLVCQLRRQLEHDESIWRAQNALRFARKPSVFASTTVPCANQSSSDRTVRWHNIVHGHAGCYQTRPSKQAAYVVLVVLLDAKIILPYHHHHT